LGLFQPIPVLTPSGTGLCSRPRSALAAAAARSRLPRRTIASFRHDNPEAIVAASAAFIQFCRETGLVSVATARELAATGQGSPGLGDARLRGLRQ
jgi:hypothetical protein